MPTSTGPRICRLRRFTFLITRCGAPTIAGLGVDVKWDVDLLAGYQARFVRGAERRGEATSFFSVVAPQLWQEIRRGAFDALVVHGHTPAAMVVAAAAAKVARIPIFLRCDTHLGLRRSAVKRLLRRPLLGLYYRQLDGVLAIGSANREFYRAMGIPERRIFDMPYAVDNRRFMTGGAAGGWRAQGAARRVWRP